MLFISHDLGVVSDIADRVAVMYTGRIVEELSSEKMFVNALHPYTKALMNSVPDGKPRGEKLSTIKGTVPAFEELPSGCHFAPRCPKSMPECLTNVPNVESIDTETRVACFLHKSNNVKVKN